jgi:hypothetical protein
MEMSLPHELEMSLSTGISREDLQIVAEMVVMRLPLRTPEQRRVARAREVLAAEAELARAISAHTQHALISCQGSHGAANLANDTSVLFEAFTTYATLVRGVAAEYRGLVRDAGDRLPLVHGFEHPQSLQLS